MVLRQDTTDIFVQADPSNKNVDIHRFLIRGIDKNIACSCKKYNYKELDKQMLGNKI